MERVHLILGYGIVVLNLAAGIWGLVRRTVPAADVRPADQPFRERVFLQLRALAFTTMVAAGIAGLMLLGEGERPKDPLHTRVYGPFMVIALVVAFGFRAESSALRFQRVLAVASLVIAALGARALSTA